MKVALLQLLLAATPAAPLPPECELPDQRDALVLRDFAQKSGSVSVGLDSVATWCFDNSGKWTGGSKAKVVPEKPEGDCAKAIAACEAAKEKITEVSRDTLVGTLEDLKRPYRGLTYKPKRSGLSDRPTEAADCGSRVRSELYTQAAARMDLARLASQAQSEYANYRTWLYTESLRCVRAVRLGQTEARRGISIDGTAAQPVDAGAPVKTTVISNSNGSSATTGGTEVTASDTGTAAVRTARNSKTGDAGLRDAGATLATASGAPTPADAGASNAPVAAAAPVDAGTPVTASAVAVSTSTPATSADAGASSTVSTPTASAAQAAAETAAQETALLERWRYFAAERAKLERDGDYVGGFLNSKELRDCKCQRVTPGSMVARIEGHDNVAQLIADDPKNNACELCLLDAYVGWKTRSQKWCKQMGTLSDYEVGVLERSDEGSGIPPRCFEEVRAKRAAAKPGTPVAQGAGTPGVKMGAAIDAGAAPSGVTPGAVVPATSAPGTAKSGFVISRLDAAPTSGAAMRVNVDAYQPPESYAPIPAREDGRLYVRLFMSASCSADIWPGPMKARTGDLMPIAFNSRSLTVKSPCGGLAEVYWGREERPRVSEVFGRNQPLSLQFQPQ